MKKSLSGQRFHFLFQMPILLVFFLSAFLAACSSSAANAGPTDNCGLIEPTDANIQYTLSFGKDSFTSNDWIKSYTVEPYKVSVSRNNDVEGAVAYTEFLIFNCGYGQADMDKYFGADGFNIVFAGYQSHTLSKFCEINKLSLYEYDLIDKNSAEYSARYWVKQMDDKHVLVMMLVFPKASSDKLDQYSKQIFPEYTSCP